MIDKLTSSLFSKVIIVLSGIFVSGMLSRFLSENDFGIYAMSLSIMSLLSLIGSSGLHLSISKNYHLFKNKSKLHNYILITYSFGFIVFSFVFLLFQFFLNENINDIVESVNYIFVIGLIFSILRVSADYFRATNRVKLFLTFNTLSSGGGTFLWLFFLSQVFLLSYLNYLSLQNVFYTLIFSSLVTLLISFHFLKIHFSHLFFKLINIKNFIVDDNFFNFFKSSLSLMSLNILFQFSTFFPIWFLGFFFSPIEAGYFFASTKICSVILIPLSVVDVVFPTDIAKSFSQKNNFELQKLISKLSLIRFISSFVIFLFVYLFSSEIILLIFGKDFIIIESIIKILTLFYLPQFIFGPSRQLLMLTNASKILNIIDLFIVITSVVIYFLLLNILTLELFTLIFSIISFFRYFIYFIVSYFYVGVNTLPNPFLLLKIIDDKRP